MDKKKQTIEDIFNDDDLGLLDAEVKDTPVKTDDDRLIESFKEINVFIDKHNREPDESNMSEYGLIARLKNFRGNEAQKEILKPYDKHDLLGGDVMEKTSIYGILQDDDLGLLDTDENLDIFNLKHIPKNQDRASADFVAQRKPMKEKEFKSYEKKFFQVHREIKEGKRKIRPFSNIEKNLKIGYYYIMNGVMLYLESAELKKEKHQYKKGNKARLDGRTRTIFENGTYSNMRYRSLGTLIQKDGKLITANAAIDRGLLDNITAQVGDEDVQSGYIYVLKTKSTQKELANLKDLYKIGFTHNAVDDRIKNAKNEATYLFADVKKVATYGVYNMNANKLEGLLHRFFGNACLDIDLFNEQGRRINPREWFVVPLHVIEEAIQLIISGNITHYEYDNETKKIRLKGGI